MRWLSDTSVERLRADIDLPDLTGTQYSLIRKIATGGMGTVYLADDARLDRHVALKVMKLLDVSEELGERMLREARILARLEHPSIVPVHDVGTLPDGRVYYVMKYVEGERLDQHARSSTSLTDLLRIFQKICEAVAFAHVHGVLHRDLKPENIMVGTFGEVLVLDWGVAKLIQSDSKSTVDDTEDARRSPVIHAVPDGENGSSETAAGTIVGTRDYMAPEQARGEPVDQRADVYALGAILATLLTGQPAIARQKHVATGARTRMFGRDEPPDPESEQRNSAFERQSGGRKIPRRIKAIIMKAMAADAATRYRTAADLAREIAFYLDGLPISAYRENPLERAGRWIEQNRFVTILVIAYLLMRVILLMVTGR